MRKLERHAPSILPSVTVLVGMEDVIILVDCTVVSVLVILTESQVAVHQSVDTFQWESMKKLTRALAPVRHIETSRHAIKLRVVGVGNIDEVFQVSLRSQTIPGRGWSTWFTKCKVIIFWIVSPFAHVPLFIRDRPQNRFCRCSDHNNRGVVGDKGWRWPRDR